MLEQGRQEGQQREGGEKRREPQGTQGRQGKATGQGLRNDERKREGNPPGYGELGGSPGKRIVLAHSSQTAYHLPLCKIYQGTHVSSQ